MFKTTKRILAIATVTVVAAPTAALADTTPTGTDQSQPAVSQTSDKPVSSPTTLSLACASGKHISTGKLTL